ncbi:hypothetical protein L1987_18800 [Smallanthus sonchifolius]|uniref:Uncharacterized protein n=1 Tax=Smallanthus sonchifolius TaxID=185202 RepID=A0ACB9J0S0_9ASTR|nr:hypothetical protein L1987_18800 [Smallanthus sonchifolius]
MKGAVQIRPALSGLLAPAVGAEIKREQDKSSCSSPYTPIYTKKMECNLCHNHHHVGVGNGVESGIIQKDGDGLLMDLILAYLNKSSSLRFDAGVEYKQGYNDGDVIFMLLASLVIIMMIMTLECCASKAIMMMMM